MAAMTTTEETLGNNESNVLTGAERLRELTVYLCRAFESDDAFSLSRLSRLLFSIDLAEFRHNGISLTKKSYIKSKDGSAEPQDMATLLLSMQEQGELALASRNPLDVSERKPLALREADMSLFHPAELYRVDDEIAAERTNLEQTASQVAWLIAPARIGEEIPLSIILVNRRELTLEEKAFAEELDLSNLTTLV